MAIKNVSPPFQFYSALNVSGTTSYTSSASSILYKDNIGLQYAFTGSVSGIIDVQVSNDYNPGLPESAGSLNAGTWTSLVQTAPNTLPVIVTVGVTSVFVNVDQIAASYLRTVWTNSSGSGSGTITGVFVAKSLG